MSAARAMLDRAVAAWNGKDEAAFVDLGSPGIELVASGGPDASGLDAFRGWYRMWTEAFPDRTVRYFNVVGDEGQVIGEGIFTGTHTGTLHLPAGDVPATGRAVTIPYVAVMKSASGRITYLRHYLDVMDVMVQLGLVPNPAAV
jgi:predicted ester cyclase